MESAKSPAGYGTMTRIGFVKVWEAALNTRQRLKANAVATVLASLFIALLLQK
jgi:hypothetical protein